MVVLGAGSKILHQNYKVYLCLSGNFTGSVYRCMYVDYLCMYVSVVLQSECMPEYNKIILKVVISYSQGSSLKMPPGVWIDSSSGENICLSHLYLIRLVNMPTTISK